MGGCELAKATFEFVQDGNTDGTTGELETIIVEVEGLVMRESVDDLGYFVLRTEGWSIDEEEELAALVRRVKECVKGIL